MDKNMFHVIFVFSSIANSVSFSEESNRTQISVFLFFTITANDRGYGHGRVAGVIAVALRQGECGRKTCKVHVSQPVNIGVCWQLAVQSLYSRHLFLSSKFLIVNAIISLFCFMCFLLSQLK